MRLCVTAATAFVLSAAFRTTLAASEGQVLCAQEEFCQSVGLSESGTDDNDVVQTLLQPLTRQISGDDAIDRALACVSWTALYNCRNKIVGKYLGEGKISNPCPATGSPTLPTVGAPECAARVKPMTYVGGVACGATRRGSEEYGILPDAVSSAGVLPGGKAAFYSVCDLVNKQYTWDTCPNEGCRCLSDTDGLCEEISCPGPGTPLERFGLERRYNSLPIACTVNMEVRRTTKLSANFDWSQTSFFFEGETPISVRETCSAISTSGILISSTAQGSIEWSGMASQSLDTDKKITQSPETHFWYGVSLWTSTNLRVGRRQATNKYCGASSWGGYFYKVVATCSTIVYSTSRTCSVGPDPGNNCKPTEKPICELGLCEDYLWWNWGPDQGT